MQKPHQSSAAAAAAAAAFQLTLSQRKRSVYSDTHRERKRGKEKGLPNKRTSSSPLKSHFAGREPVRAAKSTPDQTDVLFPRFRRALVCFPVLSRVARAAKRAESCCRCRALRSSCFINDALSSQVNSPARARARVSLYTLPPRPAFSHVAQRDYDFTTSSPLARRQRLYSRGISRLRLVCSPGNLEESAQVALPIHTSGPAHSPFLLGTHAAATRWAVFSESASRLESKPIPFSWRGREGDYRQMGAISADVYEPLSSKREILSKNSLSIPPALSLARL